jgi:hypothetical protein
MPIDTPRNEYKNMSDAWRDCDDVIAGSRTVKASGARYLPILSGQNETEYRAYVQRAMFYNGTKRTVQGLSGAVFRKAPTTNGVPSTVEPDLKDVTLAGVSFDGFAKQVFDKVLGTGRYGVLVDMPADDAKTPGKPTRPYWVPYTAVQIVNWDTQQREGVTTLTLVVLRECVHEPDPKDRFTPVEIEQYRVLELGAPVTIVDGKALDQPTADGRMVYRSTLYRQDALKKEWVVYQGPVTPTRRGEPLDFIPFYFFGPDGIGPDVQPPPLSDLVEVNLAHYRGSADLKHGLHYTALPTPYVCGYNGSDRLHIGPTVAWTFTDVNAKVGMLEFTGQGLKALRDDLQDMQDLMARLGARLLEGQKNDAEAADTVRMRHSGDDSVLKNISTTVAQGLTEVLRTHVWWSTGAERDTKIEVALNAEFFAIRLSADDLRALMLSWQGGAMSFDTLYYNLQRGDLARPAIDVDQERSDIDAEAADAPPPIDPNNPSLGRPAANPPAPAPQPGPQPPKA